MGVNGEPVRVVGVPLGLRTSGVLRSFQTPLSRSSQWVDAQASTSTMGAHQAKPASTTAEATPTDRADQAARDEVEVEIHRRSGHPAVELTRGGQVVGQFGILEVADAGRIDTAVDQAFVEPG